MTDFTKPVQVQSPEDDTWHDAAVCIESKAVPGTWMVIFHDVYGYLKTRGGGELEVYFRNKPEPKRRVPFTLYTVPWTHVFCNNGVVTMGFTTISAATEKSVKLHGENWMPWSKLSTDFLHAPSPSTPADEWLLCETETP